MLPVTQDERERLIGEFWSSVRLRLMKHYKRCEDQAARGIGRYREQIHQRGVTDLVFNQGMQRTAEVIGGLLEHGFPLQP
jgi:hypothetical protein